MRRSFENERAWDGDGEIVNVINIVSERANARASIQYTTFRFLSSPLLDGMCF
jgi:hypothetical protein